MHLTALKPSPAPSQAALKSARVVVERLLDREKANNGGKVRTWDPALHTASAPLARLSAARISWGGPVTARMLHMIFT